MPAGRCSEAEQGREGARNFPARRCGHPAKVPFEIGVHAGEWRWHPAPPGRRSCADTTVAQTGLARPAVVRFAGRQMRRWRGGSACRATLLVSFAHRGARPRRGGRAGRTDAPHGVVETPAFMVVGTQATVKSLTPDEVRGSARRSSSPTPTISTCGPAPELVASSAACTASWAGTARSMTDSGGFQVFSLGFGARARRRQDGHDLPRRGGRTAGQAAASARA